MNVKKLKAKMVEKDMNVDKLAELIGINRSTLYRKLDDGGSFTIREAQMIKHTLGMTNDEARSIFFA